MNTLPDNVQDTIYKYAHQLEFKTVSDQLKCGVCYCGWCGHRHWTWTECDCLHAARQREVANTRLMMEERDRKQEQVMQYYMSAGLSRGEAWLRWVEYMRSHGFIAFDFLRF